MVKALSTLMIHTSMLEILLKDNFMDKELQFSLPVLTRENGIEESLFKDNIYSMIAFNINLKTGNFVYLKTDLIMISLLKA